MVIERNDTESCRTRQIGCGQRVGGAHRQRRRRKPAPEGGRVFFSPKTPQHVKRPGLGDWLAGAATVAAAAAWFALLSALAG